MSLNPISVPSYLCGLGQVTKPISTLMLATSEGYCKNLKSNSHKEFGTEPGT